MSIDRNELDAVLARFEGEALETEFQPAVMRLVGAIAELYGADGAGLMLVDDQNALTYAAASDEASRILESVQADLGHGPCVDSLVHDEVVVCDDLEADGRWPQVAARVVPHGVAAVIGIPVHVRGIAVGSLNVYRSVPHAWDDTEVAGLERFNEVVEGMVAAALVARQQGTLARQLQHALEVRVIIERAVGVVMGVEGVDAVDGFDRLRRVARAARRPVADLAREVLETRRPPKPPASS